MDLEKMTGTLRKRIYDVIESPNPEDWKGKWFDDFMIVLIVTNVVAVVLETVESLSVAYKTFFDVFELFSAAGASCTGSRPHCSATISRSVQSGAIL